MVHYLIFSGLDLAIVLASCMFYYRKKMISGRSFILSVFSFVVLNVLVYFFIYK
jgi:hypothetical protein